MGRFLSTLESSIPTGAYHKWLLPVGWSTCMGSDAVGSRLEQLIINWLVCVILCTYLTLTPSTNKKGLLHKLIQNQLDVIKDYSNRKHWPLSYLNLHGSTLYLQKTKYLRVLVKGIMWNVFYRYQRYGAILWMGPCLCLHTATVSTIPLLIY